MKNKHLLKVEFLSEDRILSFSWVCLSNLDTVQVDITVGIGEILDGQLVGLLYIEHQTAHLRENSAKKTYMQKI